MDGHDPVTGPRTSYDRLFCALLPRLYRRTVGLTGNRHAAEDALHDAYVKLARHPHRLLAHPEPYAYAYATVLSTLRDGWRRRGREVPSGQLPSGLRTACDGGLGAREAELETLRLMTYLTARQASVVLLVDVAGHTLDQAAALLGRHRGTVARTRTQALRKLRAVVDTGGQARRDPDAAVRSPARAPRRGPPRRPSSPPCGPGADLGAAPAAPSSPAL